VVSVRFLQIPGKRSVQSSPRADFLIGVIFGLLDFHHFTFPPIFWRKDGLSRDFAIGLELGMSGVRRLSSERFMVQSP
jgi:hypothetical protein